MHTQKLLLNIPDTLVEQIDHYKDIAKEPSRSKTIIDLLKYALTLPPCFKDFDWQKAEAEADEAIKKGKMKSFDNAKGLLADLKEKGDRFIFMP